MVLSIAAWRLILRSSSVMPVSKVLSRLSIRLRRSALIFVLLSFLRYMLLEALHY